jgi:diguanylate cyclase (GGDEF)-like protein
VLSGRASLSDLGEIDFLNFAINRGVITLVLYATCLLIHWHNCASEVLRKLATTDCLTGALNRRHFMELMARENHRVDRYGAAYSILMIDIDHFKRINDTYGHQVGDNTIQAMAEVCKKVSRSTDIVARYGGEEFIITLTHTDQACALIVAEHLRIAASEIAIPNECGAVKFTISIGVATYRKESSIDDIIRRADCALYRAKTGGRNQVCAEENSDNAASARGPGSSDGEPCQSAHVDIVNMNAA